jgi:hypothetical protein
MDLLSEAQNVIYSISTKFGVPPPRVVVSGGVSYPYYQGGTIYLPANLNPAYLDRVVAHEMAHHLHSYFGVPVNTPQAEDFASTFEEVWERSNRRFSYPSPGLGTAVGVGILTGTFAYFWAKHMQKSGVEMKPEKIAAYSAGIAAFLAGLIL